MVLVYRCLFVSGLLAKLREKRLQHHHNIFRMVRRCHWHRTIKLGRGWPKVHVTRPKKNQRRTDDAIQRNQPGRGYRVALLFVCLSVRWFVRLSPVCRLQCVLLPADRTYLLISDCLSTTEFAVVRGRISRETSAGDQLSSASFCDSIPKGTDASVVRWAAEED